MRQTVKIPENHELHLDVKVPARIPAGDAEILLVVTPVTIPDKNEGLLLLAGCLAGSPRFTRDGVTLQRELRDEWN